MLGATVIKVVENTATPFLKDLIAGLRTSAMNNLVGRACQQTTSNHLLDLNRSRHRSPNKTVGFYAGAADSVSFSADDHKAVVAINQVGIGQRLRGGVIRPTGRTSSITGNPIKHLAIPARDEALDRAPSSFTDLVVLFSRGRKAYALAKAFQTEIFSKTGKRRKPKQAGGEIMYWLKTEVTQNPDTSVLPKDEVYIEAATGAIKDYVDIVKRRGGER